MSLSVEVLIVGSICHDSRGACIGDVHQPGFVASGHRMMRLIAGDSMVVPCISAVIAAGVINSTYM